jgi:hypothetical protein
VWRAPEPLPLCTRSLGVAGRIVSPWCDVPPFAYDHGLKDRPSQRARCVGARHAASDLIHRETASREIAC